MNQRYSKALMLIALVAAATLVYAAWDELNKAVSSLSLMYLGLTYAATLALNSILWLVFHEGVGGNRDFLLTSRMYFGGQVAKYVPGKVWSIVYQATLKSVSVPVGNIVQGNIVVFALSVLSTAFACLTLFIYPQSILLAAIAWIVGAVCVAYSMSSDHLYKLLRRISRIWKRIELTSEVPTTEISLSGRIVIYVFVTALYVLSNVLLLYVFYDFMLADALRLTAYLGVAWLAGIVVAITPSGLGVREAVFVAMGTLSDPGSFELYASVAIIVRVIQIAQDVISAFLVPFVIGIIGRKSVA